MSGAATRAAIKRATIAAQQAIEQLDADTTDALNRLYQHYADAIAVEVASRSGNDGNIPLSSLAGLKADLAATLADLNTQRNSLLGTTLTTAADIGVSPFTAAGLAAVAAGAPVVTEAAPLSAVAATRSSDAALKFVQTFVAEDGLKLSDRLWRLDRGAKESLTEAIQRAVVKGQGAIEAARAYLAKGEPVPADVANLMNDANAASLSSTARNLMVGQGENGGGALYQAQRLFRTELNRAHGEAYMQGGENHPDFAGWKFLLSPAHPKHDICDLLSTQNLYGLGGGVYPTRERCPWPAHPNTLSFVVIVFKDEVSQADQSGKETPMEALARLTPEQQLGVLGKGKSDYYDQGLLTQGMIRSTLDSVNRRINR